MEAYYYEAYYLQLHLILPALNIVDWVLMGQDMTDQCVFQVVQVVQVPLLNSDGGEEIFKITSLIRGIFKKIAPRN